MHLHGAVGGKEGQELAPDVLSALKALSSALRKHAMYPSDHPVLVPVAETLHTHLGVPLASSQDLTFSVAHDRLEVAGVATDSSDVLLSSLANRLRAHHVRSVTFRRGLRSQELSELLESLSRDVGSHGGGLGQAPEKERARWPHIGIQPIDYDPLGLGSGAEAREDLWGGRGTPPFFTDIAGADLIRTGAAQVATNIENSLGSELTDRTIAVQLFRLAEDLKGASGAGAEILFDRLSELVFSLKPKTLAHLLKLGDEGDRTNRFLRDSSEWMEAEAIIELVKTAGQNRTDEVTLWLTRLTSKLARYTSRGARPHASESDSAIRSIVQRMIDEWELEDPRPGDYGDARARRARHAPKTRLTDAHDESTVEPERTLKMSIELDEPSELAYRAAGDLVSRGALDTLMDVLEEAPEHSRVTPPLWERMSTPDVLRRLLEVEQPNYDALDRIIENVGLAGTESMLDVLARSKVRSVRRYVFNQIAKLGPGAAPHLVKLMDDERWYVVRNMLALVGALQIWPEGMDIGSSLGHPDPRVRFEALRLAVRQPEQRERAILLALDDTDRRAIALGIREAAKACPRAAEGRLIRHLQDRRLWEDLRVLAIIALGRLRTRRAMKAVAEACLERSWGLRRRLSSDPSIVLAGVSLLANRWPQSRTARRVLRLAARSGNSDLRWAAAGERPDVMRQVASDPNRRGFA